jgi:hypothetical protein
MNAHEETRREFLKTAAVAGVGALSGVATDAQEGGVFSAKKTLDALLIKNREHEQFSAPGKNNHVPMALIGLYRLGGSPRQMQRYADGFDLSPGSAPSDGARKEAITGETWRNQLGRGGFPSYVAFFDGWTRQTSIEAVLKEAAPVLMKGASCVAYHALLRLGYALDYGSREEVASSLAYWAAGFYRGPEFDAKAEAVKADALLADLVKTAATVNIRQTGNIDSRIRAVYGSKEFSTLWRPVRLPESKPLEKISGLILETFAQSQHFTLLHALTSCQALRLLLPYLGDPRESLIAYWHSVCAAVLTLQGGKFEFGKDTAPDGGPEWPEIFTQAAASEKALEHTVKLAYSCWLESRHTRNEKYRALAARELKKPSPFI